MRYHDAYSPFGTINTFREANSDRLLDKVYNGDLDWAISLEPPTSQRIEFGKIGSTEIVFCVAASKLEEFKDRTELFTSLPLARCRFDDQLNKQVNDHLQSSDIFVEEIIETDHSALAMRLAEQGKCITAIAKGVSGQVPLPPNVKTFALHGPIILSLYAYWRQTSARMIAIRKLVELLEKDHRGIRQRPINAPLPNSGGGSIDADEAPIELPH